MNLSATVKGDKWGYKGTQLDLTLNMRDSSIEDPIQGFKRRIGNDFKSYWAAEFRREVYDNGRNNLIRIEDRSREFDTPYRLNVSGSF